MRRLLILPLLLSSGCALQTAVMPTPPIDELVRNRQYNSALAALKRSERDTPDYHARRRELQIAARAWERELLEEIDALVARQQFAAAQLRLERALPELPQTPALRRYAARFYELRDAFVAEQTTTLSRLRGEHLLSEQPLYEKLRGVEGDYRIRDAVERYREDSEFFAGKLREAGLRAIEAGDWGEARTLLSLSNRLHPDAFTASQLDIAEGEWRNLLSQQQSQALQRLRAQQQQLQARFDAAMRAGDLDRAAAVLGEAAAQDSDFSRHLAQRLEQARSAAASADIDAGNRLYGEGKVELALWHWRRAQRYDSSAELQVKIERAQRLLEHYRELREESR
jgi:hypothetical protein